MKAYTYENTKTDIPRWVNNLHETQKYGYGYETNTHFVHFYGQESPFYTISVGLTAIESKNETYTDWIQKRFGAVNIEELQLEPGNTIKGIWRPSLYYWQDIENALEINPSEQRSQEQALRILVEKLDELLMFIEPSIDGLKSYSHKTRELLILACTEVENQWTALLNLANHTPLRGRNFTTNDYVKLLPIAYFDEYQIELKNYHSLSPHKPFNNWDINNPTQSLRWYDAYNKTKHNRDAHFSEAIFQFAIDAVAANIIMYCVRFGALILLQDTHTLSGLIKQIFNIKLINSNRNSFYIPKLDFPADTRTDCFIYDSYKTKHNKSWVVNNLTV
jgi:hypothetical protein